MSDLVIIGGLNEKELMAVDYAETPDSGQAGYNRIYDATQYGWMRQYQVTICVVCFKRDMDDVIAAFPATPTNLTSCGGKNDDGSEADRIQWGSGYVLESVSHSTASPSLVSLSGVYAKDIAEAEDSYPSGLTVTCSAGVYSVRWQATLFKTLDNGLGSCGSAGLEFVKAAQEKRTVTAYTPDDESPHVNMTIQRKRRWYNILKITVDGVLVETAGVVIKEENVGTATIDTYDPGQAEEVVHSTEYLGITYPSDLEWYTEGSSICRLLWSGLPIWDFEV